MDSWVGARRIGEKIWRISVYYSIRIEPVLSISLLFQGFAVLQSPGSIKNHHHCCSRTTLRPTINNGRRLQYVCREPIEYTNWLVGGDEQSGFMRKSNSALRNNKLQNGNCCLRSMLSDGQKDSGRIQITWRQQGQQLVDYCSFFKRMRCLPNSAFRELYQFSCVDMISYHRRHQSAHTHTTAGWISLSNWVCSADLWCAIDCERSAFAAEGGELILAQGRVITLHNEHSVATRGLTFCRCFNYYCFLKRR